MSLVTVLFIFASVVRLSIAADSTELVEAGDNCTTASDCNEPNEVFNCYDGICTCNEVYAYIPQEKRPMCLANLYYGYECQYDEQCQYEGSQYACVAGSGGKSFCQCAPGYSYDDFNYCELEDFWTFGKAAGLGVGCIFAFCLSAGLIGLLIHYLHKKSGKETTVEQPEPMPSVSNAIDKQ